MKKPAPKRKSPANYVDLSGLRFGRWTVVERVANSRSGKPMWRCVCDCRATAVMHGVSIKKSKAGCRKCAPKVKAKARRLGLTPAQRLEQYERMQEWRKKARVRWYDLHRRNPVQVDDLTGQVFGRWTVIGMSPQRLDGGLVAFDCVCECGVTSVVRGTVLRAGKSTGCRACGAREAWARRDQPLRKPVRDLAGHKFGRWTVLARSPAKRNDIYWLCECECGVRKEVSGGSLRGGQSTKCLSCGARAGMASRKSRANRAA